MPTRSPLFNEDTSRVPNPIGTPPRPHRDPPLPINLHRPGLLSPIANRFPSFRALALSTCSARILLLPNPSSPVLARTQASLRIAITSSSESLSVLLPCNRACQHQAITPCPSITKQRTLQPRLPSDPPSMLPAPVPHSLVNTDSGRSILRALHLQVPEPSPAPSPTFNPSHNPCRASLSRAVPDLILPPHLCACIAQPGPSYLPSTSLHDP